MSRNSSVLSLALGVGLVWATRKILSQSRRYDLSSKVVLVTGGTRGLGLIIARQLVAENARLVICSRNAEQLQRAETELRNAGAEVLAVRCDVTKRHEVEEMMEQSVAHFGQLDVLINNAGIIQSGPLDNLSESDYEEAMRTHLFAPIHTVYAALPYLRQRPKARIVNISSIGGKVAVPHLAAYCASKFALAGFSKALRTELMREDILVTTVYPGLIRTGSPRNVFVKGQHQREYALFKTADSLPLLTGSAENAAAEVIDALKRGQAERVITPTAKLAALFDQLLPEMSADLFGALNRLLPGPAPDGRQNPRLRGYDSESAASRTFLTAPTDRAARDNNEF